MALKSTIYKVNMQVNDFDKDHYDEYALSVALHPSETVERMFIRLIAFAQNAHEYLSFTKGLSTDDEPDLWQKSLSDEIELWIDLGLPDVKRMRKAAGRSKKVSVYAYGGQKVGPWFEGVKKDLERINNLSVIYTELEVIQSVVPLIDRAMDLSFMIQDGQTSVTIGEQFFTLAQNYLYQS